MTGRKDKPLSISQYQTMLKNPLYYGVFRYKSEVYERTHQPIITKKLFDRCQEVMRLRGKHKEPQTKEFVLRGLMRCAECGKSITSELQKGHVYYRCTKRLTNCRQKYVQEEELAAQIKSFIQKVSLSDEWTKRIIDAPFLNWQVVMDENRTLQPIEIPLLIKIYKKRAMGWLIALDEPIFNKPKKPKEPPNSKPYYDYVI